MRYLLDLAPYPEEIAALERTSAIAVGIIVGAVLILAAVLIFRAVRKK
ncbi:MAG: FeoB-associated Cys-rich membrane protein [Oscillospiraceae bacterium]|nr:FeoB-associated Cys-rich membrane protein [Oscillospiraceae bacterium]MBQ3501766.1 FeoB-associated Cys-rich membrane protein [Oscillospiraceae bacterium]MBQ4547545.1 FeoB-associated Cys-rich membrane protein [Oscillospiraceae bacterium]MBQ4643078.1 FeoB-associated Cys-rich membrane protein [Oscillospiraceae bacterium]